MSQSSSVTGRTALPSDRAWVISAKHHFDRSEWQLQSATTARQLLIC